MSLKTILTTTLTLATLLQPTTAQDLPFTLGPDQPADPATQGYWINHLSLNVRNLTTSIDFYTTIFGLRHIFTLQASDRLSIAYLGHSQGGRNGTGYQTAAELARDKNNLGGLIEMLHLDVAEWDLPASTGDKGGTFGHVGMIVPDTAALQERLDCFGEDKVKVLKAYGEPTPSEGPIANANSFPAAAWEQISAEERETIVGTLSAINEAFIFVEDPDGNIIEIAPQDG